MVAGLAAALASQSAGWTAEATPESTNAVTGAVSQTTSSPAAPANPASTSAARSESASAAAHSPLVTAVLRMADAGVSASVIQTYVESTRTSDPLTPGEIIALKEHKVPDEVVALMVRQNAEARAALVRRAQETAREAALARRQRHGGMDPESYEYFQYYYLQPRATASAYRRGTLYGGPHPHLGPGGWFGGGPRFRPHYLRY